MVGLGFACDWWIPRELTWSYVPARLLAALEEAAPGQVADLEVEVGVATKATLAGLGKLRPGVPWKYTDAYRRALDRNVRRRVRKVRPRAILEIADVLAPSDVPTFSYQDMNFSVAAAYSPRVGRENVSTFPTSVAVLERLAARQTERYRAMTGVIAASDWFKGWLVEHNGVDPSRIHVIRCGINHPPSRTRTDIEPDRARLLFVGGDFYRKGGDLLVEAAAIARRRVPNLELTISTREIPAGLPDWVNAPEGLDHVAVSSLYAEHDLYVLPSRFEAYGITVLEARAAGLPCIGVDQMAMPELVSPNASKLVPPGEVEPLADAIVAAIEDADLRQRAVEEALDVREQWSWRSAAEQILALVRTG